MSVAAPPRNEEALQFKSGANTLFGILSHPPDSDGSGTGVLLLSPGLKHRVGPHRLHNKLTECFIERGLPVFRFDFHGTGDSEGELPEGTVLELHELIQTGCFTDDAATAAQFFCERAGLTSVIACGLCGGAITGVYLAERDARVRGIIGFQLPVKVIDQETDYADQISGEYSDFILGLYIKKLLKPSAWKNFFAGKSEYSLIRKSAFRRLGRLLSRGERPKQASIPAGMNRPFLAAYDEIAERTRMCWIYSEQERARYDFESDFEGACLAGKPHAYEKFVIEGSNHEFAPDAAQDRLLAIIEDWLERHHRVDERISG
jgi:alpha/beta superfamily hydrolase